MGRRYNRYSSWGRYVPVAERRAKARREMRKLEKKGVTISPIEISGRTIAHTFWGKAWCDNLERYSDFSNRLPRGRTYVRNGSVVDLQIAPGQVTARVAGSSLYTVKIAIDPLPKNRWETLRRDNAGAIDSLVELLQGRLSDGVMERICRRDTGLFPSPKEIHLSCSCPDWATMCKHVAATLYGVGARLDEQPELLFRLRDVDETQLVMDAGRGLPLSATQTDSERVLESDDLSALFGLDLDDAPAAAPKKKAAPPKKKAAPPKKKAAPVDPQMRAAIRSVERRVGVLRQTLVHFPDPDQQETLEQLEVWLSQHR